MQLRPVPLCYLLYFLRAAQSPGQNIGLYLTLKFVNIIISHPTTHRPCSFYRAFRVGTRECFRRNMTTFWLSRSLIHGAEPFLKSRELCSHPRSSQRFMEPCSQESSTDPYPVPDRSKLSHPVSPGSILILSTHPRLGLPSGLFPTFWLIMP
jgi:hypothetical protein